MNLVEELKSLDVNDIGRWPFVFRMAVIGIVFFWPKSPDFWRVAVWWETETAREGMGMMVATLAVAVAAATVIMDAARRHRGRHGENSELNT